MNARDAEKLALDYARRRIRYGDTEWVAVLNACAVYGLSIAATDRVRKALRAGPKLVAK